jgi:hypothetical protein
MNLNQVLPFVSTLVMVIFTLSVFQRWLVRKKPHFRSHRLERATILWLVSARCGPQCRLARPRHLAPADPKTMGEHPDGAAGHRESRDSIPIDSNHA